MIDIHTHILSGIDDGSDSLGKSISQLKIMAEAGTTDVVCTPHFFADFYDNNNETISRAFEALTNEVKKNEIEINLHKGAECFIIKNLSELISKENYNINDTKYVLVETTLASKEFPDVFHSELYHILKKGYKPILAHPERFYPVIQNPDLVNELIHKDVYMQVNAGSLLGFYGKDVQKVAWLLLRRGMVHFIASDNHCISEDYVLPIAMQVVAKEIDEFTANLLFIENQKKLLANDNIDYFYVEDVIEEDSFFHKFLKKVLRK